MGANSLDSLDLLKLAKLSKLGYETRVSAEDAARIGIRNVTDTMSYHMNDTGAACHVIVSDVLYIVFGGSDDANDWLNDVRLNKVSFGDTNARVHAGFARQFKSLETFLGKEIESADKPVVLTGHSSGGALALLCASTWTNADISVTVFGCPRVGDWQFAALMKDASVLRVVNDDDLVCELPTTLRGYRHTGTEFVIRKRTWKNSILRVLAPLLYRVDQHHSARYVEVLESMTR